MYVCIYVCVYIYIYIYIYIYTCPAPEHEKTKNYPHPRSQVFGRQRYLQHFLLNISKTAIKTTPRGIQLPNLLEQSQSWITDWFGARQLPSDMGALRVAPELYMYMI